MTTKLWGVWNESPYETTLIAAFTDETEANKLVALLSSLDQQMEFGGDLPVESVFGGRFYVQGIDLLGRPQDLALDPRWGPYIGCLIRDCERVGHQRNVAILRELLGDTPIPEPE